jgi:hypothetical protein
MAAAFQWSANLTGGKPARQGMKASASLFTILGQPAALGGRCCQRWAGAGQKSSC